MSTVTLQRIMFQLTKQSNYSARKQKRNKCHIKSLWAHGLRSKIICRGLGFLKKKTSWSKCAFTILRYWPTQLKMYLFSANSQYIRTHYIIKLRPCKPNKLCFHWTISMLQSLGLKKRSLHRSIKHSKDGLCFHSVKLESTILLALIVSQHQLTE